MLKSKVLKIYFSLISIVTKQNDTLYPFYDLGTSALDFGIVIFLSIAEERRIQLCLNNLCLVVVPETDKYLQKRKNKRLSIKENRNEHLPPLFRTDSNAISIVSFLPAASME